MVLQHIACEPPALFEDVIREQRTSTARIELDEGEPLPDWHGFDAVMAMGGPMNADDDEILPWLRDEKHLIAEAVAAGKPFLGVCLGAQLLAASLGARVFEGPEPEVGVLPLTLSAAAAKDPLLSEFPSEIPAFHWHSCTFGLPENAVLLASSQAYANQIFRVGRLAYGLQCHLETSVELVSEWLAVPAYAASLEQSPHTAASLLADLGRHQEAIRSHGRKLFELWLAAVAMNPLS
jgi:GMP synthase (glutamine-hydrolysing)